MTDSLAGKAARTNPGGLVALVLAAGEGRRLRPLTLRRPKPLCPVGNIPLVDHALGLAATVTAALAVNVHHGRELLEEHLAASPQVHISVEAERALGTAGALGKLRPWIDGRDVLVLNGDTWSEAVLSTYLGDWDRERPRVVVAGDPVFGPAVKVVGTFLPWLEVAALAPEPAELYETTWRPASIAGRLDVVGYDGAVFDCGSPASYLAANLQAAANAGGVLAGADSEIDGDVANSVIGSTCHIRGRLAESVVWDGGLVGESERLERAIRVSSTMTVLVR
jgi:NDP-sugar pyrophosphorylase family protein